MCVAVINKIDRPEASAKEALRLVQDLFLELANDVDQLDFAVPYTVGAARLRGHRPGPAWHGHAPLFDAIVDAAAPVAGDRDAPLRMLVAALG